MDKQKQNRIAVVLLHGIGEQRPMETLRRFVDGVFGQPGRSKPDELAELFEVRRLNLGDLKNIEGIKGDVDCYEYYWAHHMQGSKMLHIAKWIKRLFSTSSEELEKMAAHINKDLYTIIRAATVVVLLLVAVIVAIVSYIINTIEWFESGAGALLVSVITVGASLALWWGNDKTVTTVGDAARYLDNTPANVGVRQKIRAECVSFLEKLNDSVDPDYSRIIVVGHSLGSVIAYDALKLMWAKMKPHVMLPADVQTDGSLEWLYEGTRHEGGKPPSPQRALFQKVLRVNNRKWKISDLVTVGSPLTHAPVLFAGSNKVFKQLQEQRELPTCPPQRDKPQSDNMEKYCGWESDRRYMLHHAAAFAVVQWTNIFFRNDPIGGPLEKVFGNGIRDVQLSDPPSGKWTDHTRYWESGGKSASNNFTWEIRQLLRNN